MPPIGKGLPRRYPSAAARLKRREIIKQKEKPWYDDGPGTPALPGEPCRTPPHPDWTEPEKWVWERVCGGEAADFNGDLNLELNQSEPDAWTGLDRTRRTISPGFLRTILTRWPWKDAISEKGVSITGAIFEDCLDLEDAQIAGNLSLMHCSIKQANFVRVKIDGNLDFSGSAIHGSMELNDCEITQNLFIRKGAKITGIASLVGGMIGGQLDIEQASFQAEVDLNNCSIHNSLLLRDKTNLAKKISLISAKIGGNIEVIGVRMRANFDMDSCLVKRNILISSSSRIDGTIDMSHAEVGKQLGIVNSAFLTVIKAERTTIGDDFIIINSCIFGSLEAAHAEIGGNLTLNCPSLQQMDLWKSSIRGGVILGQDQGTSPNWISAGKISLRNTTIGWLTDRRDSWPEQIDLEGCTYGQLGGITGDPHQEADNRPASWFVDWLSRHQPYSPQPYEQCAKVLREAGHVAKANKVLFAGKVRERKEIIYSESKFRWAGRWILQASIGYGLGHYMFLSLLWILFFATIGTMVVRYCPGNGITPGWWECMLYSLDALLPFAKTAKSPEVLEPTTQLASIYFFVHKVVGWGLAFFLVAGLTGVTRK